MAECLPECKKYTQSWTFPVKSRTWPFDACAEIWFEDIAAIRRSFEGPLAERLRADELVFSPGGDASAWMITSERIVFEHDENHAGMFSEAKESTMTEAADPVVLYSVDRGVATVTLNRPDRYNAWTPELGDLYFDLLHRAADDPEVRVIVVTGAGRGFCAGADMGLLTGKSGEEGAKAPKGRYEPDETLSIPKPVIVAINGAAIGLGLVFALMGDIRFAAAGAKLATGFTRLGLVAEHATSWILPRLVGQPAALELLISGRTFLAEEALEMGLVRKVFPKEELLEKTLEYARELAASCSPLAMALIKKQVYRDADRPLAAALADSRRLTDRSLGFEDFKEAMSAFGMKRPPSFGGISSKDASGFID